MEIDRHPLVSEDEEINLSIIASFIEKHPEDAEKWLEHLNEAFTSERTYNMQRRRRTARVPLDENSIDQFIPTGEPNEQALDINSVCCKCNRTWETTQAHPTTTLLCGHKYHTICHALHQYNEDDLCCIDTCNFRTMPLIRAISRRQERNRADATTILIEAIKNNPAFIPDLKQVKKIISRATLCYNQYIRKEQIIKRNLVKRHIFSIRQLQSDMNNTAKSLNTTVEYKQLKSSIQAYIKFNRTVMQKYHVSMRDLRKHNLIKSFNWRVRSLLENHQRINQSGWRFRVSIMPGSNKWDGYNSEQEEI